MKLWKYRELLLYMSILEFKLRYKGTFLGFLWSILEPLAQLGILYVVFSFLRPADESFIIHLFNGLIIIHFFSRSSTHAMNNLIAKRSIVTSVNIPKILFPLSSMLTQLLTFIIEIVILFIFIIMFGIELTPNVLFLIPIFLLVIILTTGVSILTSLIRLHFKDFQTIWGIITMSLIFIMPVFWYVDDMPKEVSKIFLLNPLATLIHMTHQSLLFTVTPSLQEFMYVITISFAILAVGYFVFNKKQDKMVELL